MNNYFTDDSLTLEQKLSKRKWLLNSLLQVARKELFIGKAQTEGKQRIYLRSQIEEFLRSSDAFREIEFYGVSDPNGNGNFKLKLFRSDLEQIDFRCWGYSHEITDEFQNMRNTYLSSNILNMLQLLEEIIKDQGNKKVRIFPMVDSKKANLGYQYAYTSSSLEQVRLNNIEWLPKNPSYFDIDLNGDINSDGYKRSKYNLVHILHLLITHNTMFVIKKEGGTQSDGEMICAFDFNGFLKREEIFSEGRNHVLHINKYSSNFYEKGVFDRYVSKWNNAWKYHMAFTTGAKNSDFWYYMEIIKNKVGEFGEYMNDILNIDVQTN